MCVANGNRQSVGRICLHVTGDIEQRFHHGLNLFLVRGASASDGLLDRPRRVLRHWNRATHNGGDRGTPRLPELQRGHRIVADKHLFHRCFMRLPLFQNLANPAVYMSQLVGKRDALDADVSHAGRQVGTDPLA